MGRAARAEATATILYQPVNDRPVANDDSYTDDDLLFLRGPEDVAIEIPIIELLKNDFDPEGFGSTFENAGEAVNGDLQIINGDTIVFVPGCRLLWRSDLRLHHHRPGRPGRWRRGHLVLRQCQRCSAGGRAR